MKKKLYELIEEAQNGSDKATMEIIDRFKNVIYKMSNDIHGLNGYGAEDIESVLKLKILKVITTIDLRDYEEDNGGKLAKYIRKSLKNKFIDLLTLKSNQVPEIVIDSDKDVYAEIERINIEHSKLLDNLTPVQQKIMIGYYLDKYNMVELARKLGMSRQAISRNLKKAQQILAENAIRNNLLKYDEDEMQQK